MQVVVDCKRDRQPVDTEGDYRRTILEHLFHEALSSRFYKIAVSPMAPFFSASTSISFPTSIIETCALSISVQAGGELRALETVLREVCLFLSLSLIVSLVICRILCLSL